MSINDRKPQASPDLSSNDRGHFITAAALNTAIPAGEEGWFAIVSSTDSVWVWDTTTSAWLDSGKPATDVVGSEYIIYSTTQHVVAIDKFGVIIAGGAGSLHVTDKTDFAEVFAYVVNSSTREPAIKVLASDPDLEIGYHCKSSRTLARAFTLWGEGKNRTRIIADAILVGAVVFTIDPPADSSRWITRIDSVKFMANDAANKPGTYIYSDAMTEILVTNTEFRDAANYGLNVSAPEYWNYITNCWFLAGANLKVDTALELILIGNVFSGGIVTVTNSAKVIRRGNSLRDGAYWLLTGTTLSEADEISVSDNKPNFADTFKGIGTNIGDIAVRVLNHGWPAGDVTISNANHEMVFGGTNGKITSSPLSSPAWTIAWWGKIDTFNKGGFFTKSSAWNNGIDSLIGAEGAYSVQFKVGNGVAAQKDVYVASAVVGNALHHYMLELSAAGVLKLYVDNVLVNTNTGVPYDAVTAADFRIGYSEGRGEYFDGAMPKFSFYNRLLTDTEKSALFLLGSVGAIPVLNGLILDYDAGFYWGTEATPTGMRDTGKDVRALPAGTNGQVLTADNTTLLGIKWA